VRAGTGHRRAAEAVAEALRARWPGARIDCVDALAEAPRWFRFAYDWSYLFLVRYCSWVWRLTFALSDAKPVYRLAQPCRRLWNRWVARTFLRRLRDRPPDLVVATHFLPADLFGAARCAGSLRAPAAVVITDLYPHRFWLTPEVSATVVASPESRARCLERGLPPDRVKVIGIPISARFGQASDRVELQARFGLAPERATVLVTSGGTTVGRFIEVVRALWALESPLPGRLQLLVVCGRARRVRARLQALAPSQAMPTRVFGFVEEMPELMAAADLVVSKAGGLTVAEALSRGLPMVLYHVIPGQERLNARAVVEAGAGWVASRPSAVAALVRACVEDPARRAAARQAALRLARPDAAARLVDEILAPLLP
jgi:processive 1,2-diacylglycerol beta-glucosyltransferase